MHLLLIDDHPLFRTGFQAALAQESSHYIVETVASVAAALQVLAGTSAIDIVLIDWHLAGEDGLDALRCIGQRHPSVARVILSGDDDPQTVERALQAGACGFLSKSFSVEQLLSALQRLVAGDIVLPPSRQCSLPELTLRQLEVITMLSMGCNNKEIARELRLAERTVKAHLTSLYQLLGASNRTQAVLAAQRLGLLPP